MNDRVTTRLRAPGPPRPKAALAVWVIVLDAHERILLGRHRSGTLDLPGGAVEPGERLEQTAARELHEETGLLARPDDVTVFAVLLDEVEGVPRITAATIVTRYQGEPAVQEGEAYTSWTWAKLSALPPGLFVPCGQVLRARWPHLPIDHPPTNLYKTVSAGQLTADSAPQR